MPLTRKEFVRYSLLFTAGVVIPGLLDGCAPTEPPEVVNARFVQNLEKILGVTPQTTRYDIAQLELIHAYDNWMTNQEVGTFINDEGKRITLKTASDGEFIVLRSNKTVIYPQNTQWAPHELISDGKNRLIVYATPNFIDILTRDQQGLNLFKSFLNYYFAEDFQPVFPSSDRVMHWNFVANNIQMSYQEPPDNGGQPLRRDWGAASRTLLLPGQDSPKRRVDVLINFQNQHRMAQDMGVTPARRLTAAFANEETNFLGKMLLKTATSGKTKDAASSLAGALSMYSDSFARLMLGEYGFEVTKKLGEYMDMHATGRIR